MGSYLSAQQYKRYTTGQDVSSLVSNTFSLLSTIPVATTSLTIDTPLIAALNALDIITIYDLASTEEVIVQSAASIGSTTIIVSPTTYSHVAKTQCSSESSSESTSDVSSGSLSVMLQSASSSIDNYCNQSLYAQTVTDTLQLNTMKAAVSVEGFLVLNPSHWPVNNINSINVEYTNGSTITFDETRAIIDHQAELIKVPVFAVDSHVSSSMFLQLLTNYAQGIVAISYTAGFAQIPADVIQACVWFTNDALNDAINPQGTISERLGQRQFSYGKTSRFEDRAYQKLKNYRRNM